MWAPYNYQEDRRGQVVTKLKYASEYYYPSFKANNTIFNMAI